MAGAVWALACLHVASASAAGPDCDAASRDLERAQQALSRAMRDSDTTAAAYVQCKEKSQPCTLQKAAYDAALLVKTRAQVALKVAATKRQSLCE
jgi:hypothetical protein